MPNRRPQALALPTPAGVMSRRAAGFTLVELLIVTAILALLVGLLLPALGSTMSSARGFKCKMSLRSVAFDFNVFADDQLHGSRGEDERELPHGSFRLETFQNAQYGLAEFWSYGNLSAVRLPDAQGRDPMRCAAVKGDVVLRRDVPCTQGGVGPYENISFGFNIRLHVSERQALAGSAPGVVLTSAIRDGTSFAAPGSIPLVWDVDGAVAGTHGVSPVFSGPSMNSQMLFVDDQFWFPGMRHAGNLNAAFIDGHVASSRTPLAERNWAWDFEPAR